MKKRKPKAQAKAKHYQLRWDVFKAVEIVEDFEKKHGKIEIDYLTLRKIYKGNLLEALHFQKIENYQHYGVTFYADVERQDGSRGIVERGIKLSEKMKFSEFINGYPDCYVNHGHGLQTKGWKGAGDYWLEMMDKEFPDCICHDARATANCLVKE